MAAKGNRKAAHPSFTAMERAAIKAYIRYHPRLSGYLTKQNYLSAVTRDIVLERLQKEGLLDPPPISKTTGTFLHLDSTSPSKRDKPSL